MANINNILSKEDKEDKEELSFLKKKVQESHDHSRENNNRFREFSKFVLQSTLNNRDVNTLQELQMPPIEFNIIEPYINRLMDERRKMGLGFTVTKAPTSPPVSSEVLSFLEGHLRAFSEHAEKKDVAGTIYGNMLVGGKAGAEIYTEYRNERSFEQDICVAASFDPTMWGYDPMARESHKGDGEYCFKMTPYTADDLEKLFGKGVTKGISFRRSISGFIWSYKNNRIPIALVCEMFQKTYKRERIYEFENGVVLTRREYEQMQQEWMDAQIWDAPPVPVRDRMTDLVEIEKITFTENMKLKTEKTPFRYLPLVEFEGNAAPIYTTTSDGGSTVGKMTRPFAYHAKDLQRLKNLAGQTLANELENMIQHKWIMAIESVSEDYQESLINNQIPSVVLYKAFHNNDPDKPLPPPREVTRVPTPPEVSGTFNSMDNMIQHIFGTYDAALGITNKDLSGTALRQGALNSNGASSNYVYGFINGWTRVAQVYIDLLPKYWVTPRTVPVIELDGSRSSVEINPAPGKDGITLNYDSAFLDVTVKAGPSFEVQKQVSLEMLLKLMNSSNAIRQLIETKGLDLLFDNIDIRGGEALKEKAAEFMKEQEEAMQNSQQQPSPEELIGQIEMAKIAERKESAQLKALIDAKTEMMKNSVATANVAVKNKEADQKFAIDLAELDGKTDDRLIQREKTAAENARTTVDLAINTERHIREQDKELEEIIE